MRSKVGKWGGSSAIRLPKAAIDKLGIREGADVDLSVEDGKLIVRPVALRYSLDDLVNEARGMTAPEPVDDEPMGAEWPSS